MMCVKHDDPYPHGYRQNQYGGGAPNRLEGWWHVSMTRKLSGPFGVLLMSLVIDLVNIMRLIHGFLPLPFFVSWGVAGLVALYLTLSSRQSKVLRVVLWIILSVAVLLLSLVSDGSNLSLWVWVALISGPVTTSPRRRMAAGLIGLTHVVAQFVLLPLPIHSAPVAFFMIPVTGLIGLLLWHQWRRPVVTLEQTL